MQVQELEQQIRDFIKSWSNAEFVGYLKVEKLNPGYKFIIGIPSYMAQTSIATDIDSPEEFLEFIKQELKSRNYIRQDYYRVYRMKDSREE